MGLGELAEPFVEDIARMLQDDEIGDEAKMALEKLRPMIIAVKVKRLAQSFSTSVMNMVHRLPATFEKEAR